MMPADDATCIIEEPRICLRQPSGDTNLSPESTGQKKTSPEGDVLSLRDA